MALPTRNAMSIFTVISASTENPLTFSIMRPGAAGAHLRNTGFTITGTYFLAATASVGSRLYESLTEKLNAVLTAHEGGGTWDCQYYMEQQSMGFGDAADQFSMSIPSSSPFTSQVFGYAIGLHRVPASAYYLSSSFGCFGHWKSSYKERSKWTRPYEPAAIYFDHEADDGTAYSIGRSNTALYSDWAFELEPKRKMWKHAATASDPYTFQHVIEDSRADKPFLMFTSTATAIVGSGDNFRHLAEGLYRFRAEGSNFKPRFRNQDYHNFVAHDCKTRVLSGGFG